MQKKLQLILGTALVAASLGSPARAGDWFKVESDHFVVTSDGQERAVREDVRQLEAFRSLGMMLLGADANSAQAQVKFDIYLLKNMSEINKVRANFSGNVAGVYMRCAEGVIAYSVLQENWRRDGSSASLEVLFHEYAHHLMFQYARSYYPVWYVEGFADFMSTSFVEDGKISLGEASPARLQTLGADRWLPFEDILKPDFRSTIENTGDMRATWNFYAQSWLLTHYMLSDDARTKKFNDYFARVARGEDPIAAFEPATGISVANLQHLLKHYLGALPMIKVTIKNPSSASIQVQALPDGADDYLLNASLLKTCPAKPQGEAILAQLRGPVADMPPERRLALDHAEILFGSPQAALDDLNAHASDDEASFDAHYLRGRALMKNANSLDPEAKADMRRQARAEFLKAYRLKKLDAPNLYFLAQSLYTEGPNTNVLNAARGARALAPNVAEYAIYEAFVDLDVGDRDRAVLALTPLASDPHDEPGSNKARQTIAAIKAGKSREEIRAVWSAAAH